MKVFKDLLTNDVLFTDSNKINLVDDYLYEVTCTHVTRRNGEIVVDGSNPSAEEGDDIEGWDDTVEYGLDLVLNQRLQSILFDKMNYKMYLKSYIQSLQKKWYEMELTNEQFADYYGKLIAYAKLLLPKLEDVDCYQGESCDPNGMLGVLEYREKPDGSGEEALMLFFKQGLESEEV